MTNRQKLYNLPIERLLGMINDNLPDNENGDTVCIMDVMGEEKPTDCNSGLTCDVCISQYLGREVR